MKLFLAAFLSLAALATLDGKTITFGSSLFSVEIPEKWIVSSDPEAQLKGAILFAADTATHESIHVLAFPNTEKLALDGDFIKDLEAGMIKASGAKVVGDAQPIKLNGISSYDVRLTTTIARDKIIYAHSYPMILNDQIYILQFKHSTSQRTER